MYKRLFHISISILLLLGLSSCATYRGFPSHGGGKRFDEEQRILAAAIRRAILQVDLSDLEAQSIGLEISSLETTGTGQPSLPGLSSLNAYLGFSSTDSFTDRQINDAPVNTNDYYNDNGSDNLSGRITGNYVMNPYLRTSNNITREDVRYLERVMQMRIRHEGKKYAAPGQADAILFVLVDVLGTNYSRIDYGVAYDDELSATCEITYYILDRKTQKLVRRADMVSAQGTYKELNIRFSPIRSKERSLGDFDQTIVPSMDAKIVQDTTEHFHENGYVAEEQSIEQKTDALYQRALIHLESGNRSDAEAVIDAIKWLDPNYPALPELEQSLQE